MILLLDFEDGELPPKQLLPENTILTFKQSPNFDSLLKLNLAGRNIAHGNPRHWLRFWQRYVVKINLLNLAMERFGAVRISSFKRPWDLSPRPPFMLWNEWRLRTHDEISKRQKFNEDLIAMGSDYLGGPNPEFLFVGTEGAIRNRPPLAYATARRWMGWFYLCLRSAHYDMSTIGMVNAERQNYPLTIQELELINPKMIVVFSTWVERIVKYWKGDIVRIPKPAAWWSMHKNMYDADYVRIMRKVKHCKGRQPDFAIPSNNII